MSLLSVYNASIDEDFQARCYMACFEIARAIIAGDSVANNSSQSLNDMPNSENFALKFIRGDAIISKQQLANFILLNTTIAADPVNADDSGFVWQTKEVWQYYVEIG